jgi:oligopeptide/dipeptide ABC transporter ATP-binding protein
MTPSDPLLALRDVKNYFPIRGGLFGKTIHFVKSVDGVSLDIERGAILALVGESGCGKTTLGRTILRLTAPTAGEIYFDAPARALAELMQLRRAIRDGSARQGDAGRFRELHARYCLTLKKEKELRGMRRRMQIVFQDPHSSLDPRMTIKGISSEPFKKDLQRGHGLTYLFITHDLGVVRFISTRAAVMYLGKIVETAPTEELFQNPLHPYTGLLMDAVPVPDPGSRRQRKLPEGEMPSPIDPPSGCRFRTRCRFAEALCAGTEPVLEEAGDAHWVACHFYRQIHRLGHGKPLVR